MNYDIDVLDNPKCILYKCISNVVNFDINKCDPIMLQIKDINDITQKYYDTYAEVGFK
jgi:hypothetical protein